jgi:hypothetical protein
VRALVFWTSYNNGPQWVELSAVGPSFAPGTYSTQGPFASGVASASWENLQPGAPYWLRVATLIDGVTVDSPTAFFNAISHCGDDKAVCATDWCPGEPKPLAYCGPETTVGCIWVDNLPPVGFFVPGQQVEVCYWVIAPIYVRIAVDFPNGGVEVLAEGLDDGRGDCFTLTAADIIGVRTAYLFSTMPTPLDSASWLVQHLLP